MIIQGKFDIDNFAFFSCERLLLLFLPFENKDYIFPIVWTNKGWSVLNFDWTNSKCVPLCIVDRIKHCLLVEHTTHFVDFASTHNQDKVAIRQSQRIILNVFTSLFWHSFYSILSTLTNISSFSVLFENTHKNVQVTLPRGCWHCWTGWGGMGTGQGGGRVQ